MSQSDDDHERAGARWDSLFGQSKPRSVIQEMAEIEPEFARLFEQFVFAGLYSRNVLDQKTRELCAVGALTVQHAHKQLASHMQAAKRMGATREEILEVILQMCVYCGMPYTLQAARLFKKMVEDGEL